MLNGKSDRSDAANSIEDRKYLEILLCNFGIYIRNWCWQWCRQWSMLERGDEHSNSITAINQTTISLRQSIVTFDSTTLLALQK